MNVLIVPGLDLNSVVHAQTEFTNESFQGNYAFTFTTGANVSAAVGVLTADGDGNITGSEIINVPAPVRKRRILSATIEATYTVLPDGMGTAADSTTIDGVTSGGNFDFVIMQAEVQDSGVKVATEIIALERTPVPLGFGIPGDLLTIHLKRLPD